MTNESKDRPITAVFAAIADLAMAMDVQAINSLPGPWEVRIDDHWTVVVNGQSEPREVKPEESMGATIRPFEAAVFFNGWLAGIMSPFDGAIADGEAANEDTLIKAIEAKIARVRAGEDGP